jgi:hypothetical protein
MLFGWIWSETISRSLFVYHNFWRCLYTAYLKRKNRIDVKIGQINSVGWFLFYYKKKSQLSWIVFMLVRNGKCNLFCLKKFIIICCYNNFAKNIFLKLSGPIFFIPKLITTTNLNIFNKGKIFKQHRHGFISGFILF